MPIFQIIGLLVLKKKIFKNFVIYSHGGHLGHVTNDYLCKLSLFLRMLHIKFGLIGQAVLEKTFEYFGHIHVYSPGAGADNPLTYYHKHKSSVHLLIPSKCSAIK